MKAQFFIKTMILGLSFTSTTQASWTCKATSNGYNFTKTKLTKSLAQRVATASCQDHSRTSNPECVRDVDCSPGESYRAQFLCQAMSNGYDHFVFERATLNVAKNAAKARCADHSRTNNKECVDLVQCRPLHYSPSPVTCATESNGYYFEYTGWNKDVIRKYTSSRCADHSRTNNRECHQFVECVGPDVSSPVPPRPPQDDNTVDPRVYEFASEAYTIAETIISVTSTLENYSSQEDWNSILLPIKKQAGRLSARLSGKAEFETVKNTLIYLSILLEPTEAYISENFERDAIFHEVKALLSLKTQVRSLIDFMRDFEGDPSQLY